MSDEQPKPKKPKKAITRRQFLVYASAASAVTAGVVLKTDAQANQPAPEDLGPEETNHQIYGYT